MEIKSVVFINCKRIPFLDLIMAKVKPWETRSRNMLKHLIGKRVYLAETGYGPPLVRCSAVIREPIKVTDRETWDRLRKGTCVPVDSDYDWKPDTKYKYLYPVTMVVPCAPFTPPEGVRHGRVWMEYNA